MIRLLLTLLHFSAVFAQDRLRKVSGDAAPEKAQEPINDYESFVHTIDSSVSTDDSIPQPPPFSFSLPEQQNHTEEPRPPSSRPMPSSSSTPPPVLIQSTLMPPGNNNQTTITMTPYDGVQVTIDIEDTLPEPIDDLEEFQRADLLERGKEDDGVKDLVRKNTTDDYYITSLPISTMPLSETNTIDDEEDEEEIINFNKLFDKTGSPEMENSTTTSTTSTTTTSESQKKTCIEAIALTKIDRDAAPGTKKETLEVSVDIGEDSDDMEDENQDQEEEAPVRKAREQKKESTTKKSVVWKKFEMNCDEEEDEKGNICKLWAIGGLCSSHRPTMFLFCRKTCLCVGPS